MLWYYARQICWGSLLVTGIVFLCAGVAYRVNARREENDPDKLDVELGAVLLAPFTWLFFLPLSIVVAVLRAILGMIFLILFAIGVLAVRKPFIVTWLEKLAIKYGSKFLLANTLLLRVFLGKPLKRSQ